MVVAYDVAQVLHHGGEREEGEVGIKEGRRGAG
jgi:hypothetical protein